MSLFLTTPTNPGQASWQSVTIPPVPLVGNAVVSGTLTAPGRFTVGTITVAGAQIGYPVAVAFVSDPALSLPPDTIFTALVTAPNTVTVYATCLAGGPFGLLANVGVAVFPVTYPD